MASILPCGRIAVDVLVATFNGSNATTVSLIADTGAEQSALPFRAMPASIQALPATGPPITFNVAGTRVRTMILTGLVAETDAQPHGGGKTSTRAIQPNIRVHFLALGTGLFGGTDGLLGMDMLDRFRADPVKDAAAASAYVAERI